MLKLRSVAFELTPRCNQRCVYCYNAWRQEPPEAAAELTTDEICRLVDRILAEAELERCTLTGGEPLLRGDILPIIDHIRGRGLQVAIISNGGLVDDGLAAALAERAVEYVQVTLAGPDAATHDALCGEGSFVRTTAAIATFVAAGVPVGGSFLCTRQNFHATAETLGKMRELGIVHHYAFNRFNPSGPAAAAVERLLPRRSEILGALAQANRFAEAHGVEVHCTQPIPRCMIDESEYPRIGFGQCAVGTEQAEYAVDPRGRLKLCTLQRDTIGSLFEHSLTELLARGAAERFRAAVPGFCKPCPHRVHCLGGCRAAAEWVHGRNDVLDPFLAQHLEAENGSPAAGRSGSEEPGAALNLSCRGFRLTIDPWHDLVFHVLSRLPIAADDASSLFSENYVRWVERRLPGPPEADTKWAASLYDASPQGFLLQAWPMLYDTIAAFRAQAETDFARCAWPTTERQDLARAIAAGSHPALPDFFQTLLRRELENGFETFWRNEMLPRSKAYADRFAAELQQMAERLPGLRRVAWVLSLPLRACGRLLRAPDGGPLVAVGVAEPELGVGPLAPVEQGCHEYFVGQVQDEQHAVSRWATVPGRPGYEDFRRTEARALALRDR